MAEINGVQMSDEQFMLSLELGNILKEEGYEPKNRELNPDDVKSERGREIIKRLIELSEKNG